MVFPLAISGIVAASHLQSGVVTGLGSSTSHYPNTSLMNSPLILQ